MDRKTIGDAISSYADIYGESPSVKWVNAFDYYDDRLPKWGQTEIFKFCDSNRHLFPEHNLSEAIPGKGTASRITGKPNVKRKRTDDSGSYDMERRARTSGKKVKIIQGKDAAIAETRKAVAGSSKVHMKKSKQVPGQSKTGKHKVERTAMEDERQGRSHGCNRDTSREQNESSEARDEHTDVPSSGSTEAAVPNRVDDGEKEDNENCKSKSEVRLSATKYRLENNRVEGKGVVARDECKRHGGSSANHTATEDGNKDSTRRLSKAEPGAVQQVRGVARSSVEVKTVEAGLVGFPTLAVAVRKQKGGDTEGKRLGDDEARENSDNKSTPRCDSGSRAKETREFTHSNDIKPVRRRRVINVESEESEQSDLSDDMSHAPLEVDDADSGKVITWPVGVKTIPFWVQSRVFHLVEGDYNAFLRYPDVLHTDSSMEFALRCVAEVNLFQVPDQNRASISTYTSPFMMNGMCRWPQRTTKELSNTADKVGKYCANIPSGLWDEWSCFPLFAFGSVGKVGHYIFVALKSLPLIYRTIRDRFDNNENLSEGFELVEILQTSEPHLIFIESLRGIGSGEIVEGVLRIARCLFYLMWNLDSSGSEVRKRSNRRNKKGSKFIDPMTVTWPHIAKFYRRTCAYIQGPSQGMSIKFGSFTITHFVYAQRKGYLDKIVSAAAQFIQFPHIGYTDASRFTTPVVKNHGLFKDRDVTNIVDVITVYASEMLREHELEWREFELQRRRKKEEGRLRRKKRQETGANAGEVEKVNSK